MEKYYLSTALPYVNEKPHCGFALEIIQADVIARYHRLLGENVFFLTGTDENSLKNIRVAKEEGIDVKKLVDRNAQKFYNLKYALNLSFDDFIRTTEKRHIEGAQKLWLACKKDIYKKTYRGLYCVGCEEFYKESELKNGFCPEHQTKPELVEEENYFFRLSKYQKQLKEIIVKEKVKIIPKTRKNEILSFIDQELEDICISRLAERGQGWGIPVPGDPSQILWTWFDALSNYINAVGYPDNPKRFKKWWPADLHIVGKGIIRFHGIYWIAILLSAKLALSKIIFVHGYLTSAGQKMSKSLGNVIDPFELVKKYGADAVRYFLLREIPPTEDGDFTYEKFEGRYNSDLASGLGNLVGRVFTMTEKYFDGKIPKMHKHPDRPPLSYLIQAEIHTWKDYNKALEDFKFDETLRIIWELISKCDRYIEQTKPWRLAAANKKEELEKIIFDLLESLHQISWMIAPFLPGTAQKIANSLGVKELKDVKKSWIPIKSETKTKKSKPLFPRLN